MDSFLLHPIVPIWGMGRSIIITQIDRDNVQGAGSARQPSYIASQVKSSVSPPFLLMRPQSFESFLHGKEKANDDSSFLFLPRRWPRIKPSRKFLHRSRNDGDIHFGYRRFLRLKLRCFCLFFLLVRPAKFGTQHFQQQQKKTRESGYQKGQPAIFGMLWLFINFSSSLAIHNNNN